MYHFRELGKMVLSADIKRCIGVVPCFKLAPLGLPELGNHGHYLCRPCLSSFPEKGRDTRRMEESDAFHALIEEYEKLSDEEFYGKCREEVGAPNPLPEYASGRGL